MHARLALLNPRRVEVSNVYAERVGVANPELKRMNHTVWSNRDGGLTYFYHNPITPNTPL